MNVYVVREPILDRGWNIAGYEIIPRLRSGTADDPEEQACAARLMAEEMLGGALDGVFGGKPVLVNFDVRSQIDGWSTLLPPAKSVMQMMKQVEPDRAILSACETLHQQGYAVAVETSFDDERTALMASVADTLKVDFQEASAADRASLIQRYRNAGLGLVAQNIRSETQFSEASRLGYDFFQGPFFASSSVHRTSGMPTSQLGSLRLLRLIQGDVLVLEAIEEAIRHDLGLSHSLLRYLNSAAFHWATSIESVRRALVLLGTQETRKWVSAATVRTISQNRPPILSAQVLTRGRFCEVLLDRAKLSKGDADPFLAGMFSLLDAMINRPMPEILDELGIGSRLRAALLGTAPQDDPLYLALNLVKAYEVGDYDAVQTAGELLGLSADGVRKCYLDTLKWVESFGPDQGRWPVSKPPVRHGFHLIRTLESKTA